MAIYRKDYNLLSLSPQNCESIINNFKDLVEESAKCLYKDILKAAKEVISDDKIDCLMNLDLVFKEIGKFTNDQCLKNYQRANGVEKFNLVALACKNKAIKVLEYLFSDECCALYNLSVEQSVIDKKESITNAEDEFCHNAFYYAIRSNMTDLLSILIEKSEYKKTELNDILSKNYKELKVRNVSLTKEMQLFVQSKILDLRFFDESTAKNSGTGNSWEQIKKRIELVVKNIRSLKTDYWDQDPDEKFLFIAESIAKSIDLLKFVLKSTYDRLPWEEIEFCLVVFIKCCKESFEPNLVYNCVLNKKQLLKHLYNFSTVLDTQHNKFKNNNVIQLAKSVKTAPDENSDEKREQIIEKIMKSNSKFRELYDDYQIIRDFYSLEIIKRYADLIESSDALGKRRLLLVSRVLQVMGENFKNSLDSPKLSNKTANILLSSMSPNTRKIITKLRDSLSHEEFLFIRSEMEKKAYLFKNIQTDILKIKAVIPDVLYSTKIAMVKRLMKKMESCDSLEEVRQCFGPYRHSIFLFSKEIESTDLIKGDYERLEEFVVLLKTKYFDKTDAETRLLDQIQYFIQKEKERFENLKRVSNINSQFVSFLNSGVPNEELFFTFIRSFCNGFMNFAPENPFGHFKWIAEALNELIGRIVSRHILPENEEMNDILHKFYLFSQFEMGSVKWIQDFKNHMIRNTDKKSQLPKQNNTLSENLLASKLSDLKEIFNDFGLKTCTSSVEISSFEKDKEQQAITEMLVLDILSILERNSCSRNPFFLDSDYSFLSGRNLRNHLAHGNALIDVCLEESSAQLLLYAMKIINAVLPKSKQKMDCVIKCDCIKLETSFDFDLKIINNQRKLFVSLEQGNMKEVEECLRKGADIYGKDCNFWTCLHFAAKAPDCAVLKWLLEQGMYYNSKTNTGENLLHIAATFNRLKIIQNLVEEQQMSLIVKNIDGKTALHFAVENQSNEVVEYISNYQICTNLKDERNLTPLHTAIIRHSNDAAKILLEKEINVDENKTHGYNTSLHIAATKENLFLVKLLIEKKAYVDARNDFGLTPLHLATLTQNLEIMKILVFNAADINAQNETGIAPLHIASEIGSMEIVDFLLESGADVEISSYELFTPLMKAAKYGHAPVAEFLLQKGALVNSKSKSGNSALHLAALSGHYEVVELLLNHGAFVGSQNNEQQTALHLSSADGRKEIVKLLLQKGADINAVTSLNKTPLHIATFYRHTDIVDLLIEEKADIHCKDVIGSTSLHIAALNADRNMVELLLKRGADIHASDKYYTTPLHSMIIKGFSDMIRPEWRDVNFSDINGNTLFHLSAEAGDQLLVEYCLENGCDINVRNNSGFTALHCAAFRNHDKIIKLLLNKGADIHVEGDSGYTPLVLAARNNFEEAVEELLSHEMTQMKSTTENIIQALKNLVLFRCSDIFDMLLKNYKFDITDEQKQDLFETAVLENLANVVNYLLETGFEINSVTESLHLAVLSNHYDMVDFLLTKGANPNLLDKNNKTPLNYAVEGRNVDMVQILCSKNASVCIERKLMLLAVKSALRTNQVEIIKLLLQMKAIDVNDKDPSGFSLLHTAAVYGSLDVTRYLINVGADINAKVNDMFTPVHLAAGEGFKDMVEFYLNIDDLKVATAELLSLAARNGKENICKLLLDRNLNANFGKEVENTLITLALEEDHKGILNVFLHHGFYYNARASSSLIKEKSTVSLLRKVEALFNAVQKNAVSEVETLLKEEGSSEYCIANAKCVKKESVLHFACFKGHEKIVEILLKLNTNPNVTTKTGNTPLHYAVKYSHFGIVKALLSVGAHFSVFSDLGKTPLDYAVDQEIRNFLLFLNNIFSKVQNNNLSLLDNLRFNNEEEKTAVIRAKNQEGKTLLDVAYISGFSYTEKLKMLFETNQEHEVKSAEKYLLEGNYAEALLAFEKILRKTVEIFGADSCPALDVEQRIAGLFYEQGNLDKALLVFKKVYDCRKNSLGEYHLKTLTNVTMIADVLLDQGKAKEALQLLEDIHLKLKEKSQPSELFMITFETLLSEALFEMKKFDRALDINNEIQRKCLDKREDTYRLNLADSFYVTAKIYEIQDKPLEALKIFQEVYEMRKDILTPHHTDTLKALRKVADILATLGELDDSLKMFEKILDIQKLQRPENHIDILESEHAIGRILCYQGRLLSALRTFLLIDRKIASVAPVSELRKVNENDVAKMKNQLTKLNFQCVFDGIHKH